ncbi:uncharacterized protein LOC141533884 [Cotesia typhae]|uniref:uncharacterized protein LOC141533884 n=1 Tax=Cotesia typhae TaxID=2053667 RepID=UPI003D689FCE
MRRGPYQKYLDRYGNCVIPRSTYYKKKKQHNITKESPEVDYSSVTAVGNPYCHRSKYNSDNIDNSQELQVVEISDGYSSNHIENSVDKKNYSNLWLHDELDDHKNITHLWFHNEYNKEIEDNEAWFDVNIFT